MIIKILASFLLMGSCFGFGVWFVRVYDDIRNNRKETTERSK